MDCLLFVLFWIDEMNVWMCEMWYLVGQECVQFVYLYDFGGIFWLYEVICIVGVDGCFEWQYELFFVDGCCIQCEIVD